MADVMTGVPSIVMGLFVATDLGQRRAARRLLDASPVRSRSACLMLPIVIRSSEEMLKLVPDDLRQASDALGARRWRTVVACRAARRAARASSAAPCSPSPAPRARPRRCCSRSGSTSTFNPNLFNGTNTTLSKEIWNNAQTAVRRRASTGRGARRSRSSSIVFVLHRDRAARVGALRDDER